MVFTKHFTDNHSTLSKGLVGGEAKFVHGVEDTTMDRFQTVTYVRDCTGYVDCHCVADK